jgi:hypothetical protein
MVNFQNTLSNKNLYIAGVPDDIVDTSPGHQGGYYPTVQFGTSLTAYLLFLLGQSSSGASWGFRSRLHVPMQAALDVGTQSGFGNNLGVSTALNPGVPVGSEAYAIGFKTSNPRLPNLSGAYRVTGVIPPGSGQPNWITVLGDTGNVDATNFLALGSIGPLQYQYLAYQNSSVIRVVRRKRGGSYGRPLGRSRARR